MPGPASNPTVWFEVPGMTETESKIENNHERPIDGANCQENRANAAAMEELRAISPKTWQIEQTKSCGILPPAKELPPQAFQSCNGACSCATPVACGRFILRPACLQIQESQMLGTPDPATLGGRVTKTEGLLVALHWLQRFRERAAANGS